MFAKMVPRDYIDLAGGKTIIILVQTNTNTSYLRSGVQDWRYIWNVRKWGLFPQADLIEVIRYLAVWLTTYVSLFKQISPSPNIQVTNIYTMAKTFSLYPVVAEDIPILAKYSAEAFIPDRQTQMKGQAEVPYDHEEGARSQ